MASPCGAGVWGGALAAVVFLSLGAEGIRVRDQGYAAVEGFHVDSTSIRCTGVSSVSLTVEFDRLEGADGYDVELALDGQDRTFVSFTGPSPPVEAYDLQPNTTYEVYVRAHPKTMMYRSYGWGGLSDPIKCTTNATDPRSPQNVRLHPDHSLARDAIHIAWDAPALADSDGGLEYTVAYRLRVPSADNEWTHILTEGSLLESVPTGEYKLTDLEASSTYEFKIGAHGSTGNRFWSDIVWFNTGREGTTVLELVRVAENGTMLPDYLGNHASADFEGEVGFLSVCQPSSCKFYDFTYSPFVRYCVEIANVEIPNTNTTNGSSAFSDYTSCLQEGLLNPPFCECDNKIDRVFAYESADTMNKFCGNKTSTRPAYACECDPESMKISATYAGMMPVPLPVAGNLFFGDIPPYSVGHYPDPIPFGHWYHFPAETVCPFGAEVGKENCTWRRFQTAYSTYGDYLVKSGYNTTDTPDGTFPDNKMVRQNAEAMRNAFKSMTQRCCGC